MWGKPKLVVLLLACSTSALLFAQDHAIASSADVRNGGGTQASVPGRLLSLDEGLAVLGAAMETAHRRTMRQDCSHFVHEIYDRAGFPYGYQNSVALYKGTGDFQRVSRPQPGDLIVWRGHMGIIVNPVQHSFFSSLRTGFGVEKYDSRYWRKRGRPRFYRYVETAPVGLTLAAAKTSSNNEGELAAEEPSAEAEEPVAIPPTSLPVTSSSNSQELENGIPTSVTADRATPEALRQALEERFSDSDSDAQLVNADLLHSSKPVVIVENFQIKKVHVKHDQGWAEVQMNEPSSLTAGQAILQRRSEKQRWPLYRSGKEWHLELPTSTIYLPKETAVRLLAHELAAMTGRRTAPTNGSQQDAQQAQLARLLDRLLGE
jgi:NlpC/P60 family